MIEWDQAVSEPAIAMLAEPDFWAYIHDVASMPKGSRLCPCCPGMVFILTEWLYLQCTACGHILAGVRRATVPYVSYGGELAGWSIHYAQIIGLRARMRGEMPVKAFVDDLWCSTFRDRAPAGCAAPMAPMVSALAVAEVLGLIERDDARGTVRPTRVMLRSIPWWPLEIEGRAPAVEVHA